MDARERLKEAAAELNACIAAGKIRATQKVVQRLHGSVWDVVKEIQSQQPVDEPLLADAMELFMDIRFGRQTTKFV